MESREPIVEIKNDPANLHVPSFQPVKSEHNRHLCTTHLLASLSQRALLGGAITAISQAARFILNVASIVILARLLSPSDFGLVAMAATLTSFLRMFREAGLSTATVQRETITHPQVSNLFWINVLLGVTASLIGVATAPLLAWFYHDSRLFSVTVALAISFLFSGSTVQHLALLNRQMRFGALACVDIGSAIIGLIVGVAMGLMSFGYWSLVGMQLAASISEIGIAWTASRWRPQLPRRGVGTRSMVNLGASLTSSALLRRVATSIDSLLIGRLFGAEALGLYNRAQVLLTRPMDQILTPFDAVALPTLSRLQDQPERYRRNFLNIYNALTLGSFIVAALFLALSEPVVLVLLGAKWVGVVPIFAAMAFIAFYYASAGISMWLLSTQGRNKDILLLGVVISVISIASYLTGLNWGPTGVALAYSLGGLLVRLPLQFWIIGRKGPVSARDLWLPIVRHFPIFLIVLFPAYYSLKLLPHWPPVSQLFVSGPLGFLAGLTAALLFPFQRQEIRFFLSTAKKLITMLRLGRQPGVDDSHKSG